MSHPRNRSLLWRLRHRFARRVRLLLDSVPRRAPVERIELVDVKPRLEYYLRAVYGRQITVDTIASEKKRTPELRTTRGFIRERTAIIVDAVSESGDDVIRLPTRLVATDDSTPFEQYRCLAVQHAERLTRATAHHESQLGSPLEKDLFELAESVGVDRHIAATQPGLRRSIESGRRSALRSRALGRGATELERRVERLVSVALATPATAPDPAVPDHARADESAEWARRTAAELVKQAPATDSARYRGIAPLGLWGTAIGSGARTGSGGASAATVQGTPPADARLKTPLDKVPRKRRRPPRRGAPEEAAAIEDPSGSDGQDAASRDPNARPVADAPLTNDASGVPAAPSATESDDPDMEHGQEGNAHRPAVPEGGVRYRYAEWDLYAKSYHPEGSIVRVRTPVASASAWAENAASEHAVLIRQVRERFAQLRAHRQRLRRQPNGDEIDLEACVTAFSDFAAGRTPDDRLYATVRSTRREMAIMLLLDVSASTDATVDAEHRVIDIERISALVAAEAFDALGDAYAINAFSSRGRNDVRVAEIKSFAERNTPVTAMRLAALEPSHATRLGAALRHATAELVLRPEPSRLLLVLSDGRPNDTDSYINQDYGAEDSRRAVAEARLAGVTPYCITVDPEEPEEYVGHIFGEAGYRVLSKTGQLPVVLMQAVQGLLRR